MRKKVVILSGAGISKESGIDTFRRSVLGKWGAAVPATAPDRRRVCTGS